MSKTATKEQVKAALCPQCGGWIMVAAFPWCESDTQVSREFMKCARRGETIEIITAEDLRSGRVVSCHCAEMREAKQQVLFDGGAV